MKQSEVRLYSKLFASRPHHLQLSDSLESQVLNTLADWIKHNKEQHLNIILWLYFNRKIFFLISSFILPGNPPLQVPAALFELSRICSVKVVGLDGFHFRLKLSNAATTAYAQL